jgi:hypothetical protein
MMMMASIAFRMVHAQLTIFASSLDKEYIIVMLSFISVPTRAGDVRRFVAACYCCSMLMLHGLEDSLRT